MKIIEKIRRKAEDPHGAEPVTLAFLGDSVTQGCFEVFKDQNGNIDTVYDITSAYHTYVRDILCTLYPKAPINIINAGIGGGSSVGGFERLHRDVLKFSPDLVVVAFGLNDATGGLQNLEKYRNAMTGICKTLVENGIEVIVMTTNMMTTSKGNDESVLEFTEKCANIQNSGVLDEFMKVAAEVSREYGCKLCDCYSKWKKLSENGVNTDLLLSNGINHPTREMNRMFANSIIETLFE
ncbi:MAG: GDSL-type esterase/lipase family protein [Monoglobales bacterium]